MSQPDKEAISIEIKNSKIVLYHELVVYYEKFGKSEIQQSILVMVGIVIGTE